MLDNGCCFIGNLYIFAIDSVQEGRNFHADSLREEQNEIAFNDPSDCTSFWSGTAVPISTLLITSAA